jgi:two-component system response regulator AtoC
MVGSSRGAILVAAGDIDAQQYLETALRSQGFVVQLADYGEDVCKIIGSTDQVSLVLLDQVGGVQVETIREIRSINQLLPIVVVTGSSSYGSPAEDQAVDAREKWRGYSNLVTLPKPIFYDDLAEAISELVPGDSAPPQASQPPPVHRPYFELSAHAEDPRLRNISTLIDRAARSDVPVLVQGETGAGKEMLVREIHSRSSRAKCPFVNIDCAALPKELVESQLFGHERGAFTGAHRSQPGLFEVADGGTILLDEIGDMDIRLQAKLLQVLQDNEFQRLGGNSTVRVDVRVMAATHRDLNQAVASGRVRADLYYRLKVISIVVPSLRERPEEIIPLAEFFLRKHSMPDTAPPELDFTVKRHLLSYDWPGNIRELENMMRRYLVLRDCEIFREMRPDVNAQADSWIDPGLEPIHSEVDGPADRSIFDSLDEAKRQAQIDALVAALDASRWNRKKAASLLRLDYKQLLYQMKKLQVEGDNRRTRSPNSPKEAGIDPRKRASGPSVPLPLALAKQRS